MLLPCGGVAPKGGQDPRSGHPFGSGQFSGPVHCARDGACQLGIRDPEQVILFSLFPFFPPPVFVHMSG